MFYLSESSQKKLEHLATEKGKSTSELMEEMINFYFINYQKELPKSIGAGKSNFSNLSERVDELLWQD